MRSSQVIGRLWVNLSPQLYGSPDIPSGKFQFLVPPACAVQNAMEGWAEFSAEMRQYYGVDMSCLDERYRREQKEYYLETSAWADVHPSQMLGPPATLKEYDLLTVTLEELAQPLRVGDLSTLGLTCDVSALQQRWSSLGSKLQQLCRSVVSHPAQSQDKHL